MRVLMLGWELPPHNSGGLGVACLNLTKRLAESGADIEFILPFDADYGIGHMKVTGTSKTMSFDDLYGAYDSFNLGRLVHGENEYIRTVMQVIDEREFDVIHAHDWLTFRAAIRAKEKTGWPLIAHVHSIESDRAGGHGNEIVREIEQLTFILADRVMAVSEHTKKKIMQEYKIPGDKIDVVHNSIDLNDLDPIDISNSYHYLKIMKQHGYKVVCNLGRQTLQKNLPNLIRAAQQVVKYHPKTIFLLVGDGEQQFELIELAAELGISRNVIFTGFLRGKAARDAFAIADLFVMPSVSEPFGLTPLESIGYGTPTLISNQSGVAEILTHTLKVDYWDVDGMANQITGAVRNNSLLDELQLNAFKQLETISWRNSANKVMDIYRGFRRVPA